MAMALQAPGKTQIHPGVLAMFDGTTSRWPTQGEAHLKERIDKDPGNYFLWSRLGNIYKIGDAHDLALATFQEAVQRNEHDVESLHSLAQIHLDRDEPEEAARHFHQVLLHARHAPPRTSRVLLRALVRDTLERLFDLHLESGKRIPLFPKVPSPEQPSSEPRVVRLESWDLGKEEDWERMVDFWMTGQEPRPGPRPSGSVPALPAKPVQTAPAPQHVGRNAPCPCGSGKKFKNCCLRD
jgi:hypothetical protein